MLGDTVDHPTKKPSMEQVSSPLSAQILEFCESELFPETTIQNSEVASSSNCCYDDHSSYTTNLSFPPDIIKYPAPTTDADANNFSIIFDEEITENDINSVNLDFTTSPHLNLPPYQFNNHDQFDLTLPQNQIPLTNDHNHPILPYPSDPGVIGPAALPTVCEDDSLSSMPPSKLMRLNNPPFSLNCSFMDPSITSYLSGNTNPPLPVETSGIFSGDLFLGELDFKGDNNGIFCPDPLPRPYNSNELQALSNESQHLVNGGGSSATPLASEITSLEADTFRVTNKLTTEERKEKIHRYLKKRNERNFSKKIKYACRKTLADSRPRVRGRFAKNDEFGENNRSNCHEEDTAEDVKSFHVVVKEEDENFESSDIFAHISGVNSFKCNYPIQSWI